MILVVGPFPPPIHGAAIVTERVFLDLMDRGVAAQRISMSPRGARIDYHLSRVRACVHACGRVFALRPSTIYISLSGGMGQIYELCIVLCARIAVVPVVFHHHSFAYCVKWSAITKMLTWTAGSSQAHVVLCEKMKEAFIAMYSPHGVVEVVSNTEYVKFDRVKPRAAGELRTIGFLSNVSLEKGVDRFFDLLEFLRNEGSGIRGRIAGPSSSPRLEGWIRERAARIGEVEYVGAVYNDSKSEFLESVDLLVFPSRYPNEAEPLVIIEAQLAGAVVVGSNRGCIAGMVHNDQALILDECASDWRRLGHQCLAWERNPAEFRTVQARNYEQLAKTWARRGAGRKRLADLLRTSGDPVGG
jgi:glycosyltransferase involved in cell wall biosynthesis